MRFRNQRLRYCYFRILKTNCHCIRILLPVSILTFCRYRHVILHLRAKFHLNLWRRYHVMSTCLTYWFGDVTHLETSRFICWPNFDEISQCTIEILRLPVSENRRLPYWNSTSCFISDLLIVIGMSFFISKANSIQIAAELWLHSNFQADSRQSCWICSK